MLPRTFVAIFYFSKPIKKRKNGGEFKSESHDINTDDYNQFRPVILYDYIPKTKGAIKNGQSRETGNIVRHREKIEETKIQYRKLKI